MLGRGRFGAGGSKPGLPVGPPFGKVGVMGLPVAGGNVVGGSGLAPPRTSPGGTGLTDGGGGTGPALVGKVTDDRFDAPLLELLLEKLGVIGGIGGGSGKSVLFDLVVSSRKLRL